MRIGYIHLDYYEERQSDTYNIQEIGLAKAFEKLGHQTVIVYWLPQKDKRCGIETNLSHGIKQVYLPYKYRFAHHVWPNLSLLESLNIEVYHLQSDNLLSVPQVVDYCIKHNWKHYCYVGTIHSSSSKSILRLIMDGLSRRNLLAFRKTKVFCKTPTVMKELKSKGVDSAEWVPVGLDTDVIPFISDTKNVIRQKLKLPTDKKIVLLVCALRQDKHPMDLFPLSEMLGEDYMFVHIGLSGEQTEEYMAKLHSNGKYQNISFIGKIPNNKIHNYYKAIDYVINLNPDEIFGMAILEAMYHDATIVARHAPGPDCIIKNNECGFLCDSLEEMAMLLKSGVRAKGAKKRILDCFTWKSTAERFLSYTQQ